MGQREGWVQAFQMMDAKERKKERKNERKKKKKRERERERMRLPLLFLRH